jgi:hypothetical protein
VIRKEELAPRLDILVQHESIVAVAHELGERCPARRAPARLAISSKLPAMSRWHETEYSAAQKIVSC